MGNVHKCHSSAAEERNGIMSINRKKVDLDQERLSWGSDISAQISVCWPDKAEHCWGHEVDADADPTCRSQTVDMKPSLGLTVVVTFVEGVHRHVVLLIQEENVRHIPVGRHCPVERLPISSSAIWAEFWTLTPLFLCELPWVLNTFSFLDCLRLQFFMLDALLVLSDCC